MYIKFFEEWLRVFPTRPNTGLDIAIKPYSPSALDIGRARGGPNILNLERTSQTFWSVLAQWEVPSDRDALRKIVIDYVGFMEVEAKKAGQFLPFRFMNDASAVQNTVGSYGRENLEKMKATSRKYDPQQVFQTLQNGGWFVSKA